MSNMDNYAVHLECSFNLNDVKLKKVIYKR